MVHNNSYWSCSWILLEAVTFCGNAVNCFWVSSSSAAQLTIQWMFMLQPHSTLGPFPRSSRQPPHRTHCHFFVVRFRMVIDHNREHQNHFFCWPASYGQFSGAEQSNLMVRVKFQHCIRDCNLFSETWLQNPWTPAVLYTVSPSDSFSVHWKDRTAELQIVAESASCPETDCATKGIYPLCCVLALPSGAPHHHVLTTLPSHKVVLVIATAVYFTAGGHPDCFGCTVWCGQRSPTQTLRCCVHYDLGPELLGPVKSWKLRAECWGALGLDLFRFYACGIVTLHVALSTCCWEVTAFY